MSTIESMSTLKRTHSGGPRADQTPGEFFFKPLGAVVDGYLGCAPLAHALFRSAEAKFVCGLRLKRPVLEIGCGKGQFGSMAFETPADAGLEPMPDRARTARQTRRYDRVICADARSTPFPPESFQTILAVSVLEHVESPQRLVAELYRALRPGGLFAGTIVLGEPCLYAKALARIGLKGAARSCQRAYDASFHHVAMLAQAEWECLFQQAGFEVLRAEGILSARAMAWYDLLLLAAWPYKLADRIGWRIVWRPRFLRRLLAMGVRKLIERGGRPGRCLFLVGRKPDHAQQREDACRDRNVQRNQEPADAG